MDLSQQKVRAALHTPLVDLLGCDWPVLCAGMGGVSRSALTVAVSRAGGLGCLGMVRESPAFVREQIYEVRTHTALPFAVNIIPAATEDELLSGQVDVIIQEHVPVVTLFWDVRPAVVKAFKQAGITVLHQVGSLEDARQAVDAGVDGLIAQGVEAGGHVRGTATTSTLVQNLVNEVSLPVIAAGGVLSGDDMASMLALGAQGVWCGTAFLMTHESFAHDYHKQRIVKAKYDATVLTLDYRINWPVEAPVRVLRNPEVQEQARESNVFRDKQQIAVQDDRPVYLLSTDSPLRNAEGDLQKMALYASQYCDQIQNVCTVAERIQQFITCVSRYIDIDDTDFRLQNSRSPCYSSPCSAESGSPEYNGFLSQAELSSVLFALLSNERDIVAACRELLRANADSALKARTETVQQDAIRYCFRLLGCLHAVGFERDPAKRATHTRCKSDDADLKVCKESLQVLLERVVGTLHQSGSKVHDPDIRYLLKDMIQGHQNSLVMLES